MPRQNTLIVFALSLIFHTDKQFLVFPDVDVPQPDEKSIITYVSSLYDAMPRVPDVQDGVRANVSAQDIGGDGCIRCCQRSVGLNVVSPLPGAGAAVA